MWNNQKKKNLTVRNSGVQTTRRNTFGMNGQGWDACCSGAKSSYYTFHGNVENKTKKRTVLNRFLLIFSLLYWRRHLFQRKKVLPNSTYKKFVLSNLRCEEQGPEWSKLGQEQLSKGRSTTYKINLKKNQTKWSSAKGKKKTTTQNNGLFTLKVHGIYQKRSSKNYT
jgi:hypothetical protein